MMDEKVVKIINETYPQMTEMEKLAFGIAFGAHTGSGQKDYAGLEYINHPLALYNMCDTEEERIVALLHDVVEDTSITKNELSLFFSKEIVDAVQALSHDKVYDKKAYMENVKANPLARKIKILDLKHNMDRTRLESLLEWHDKRVENQYKGNLEFLEYDEEENIEKSEENPEKDEVNNKSKLYTGLRLSECSEDQIEESRKYDKNTDSYLEDVRDESSLYPIDFIWMNKYKMWLCED